jgi:dTDP-glucose 4,6-dehydratase
VTGAMRRLLVTGGAGFIGSNFVHQWSRTSPGDRLVVIDALRYAGNPHNLAGLSGRDEYRFVQADICDTAQVTALLREERIDTIVHFAAESHVDRSITGPDAFINANVLGTHSLLKAARGEWLGGGAVRPHRFHHVSTDEVYGSLGPRDPAFTETTPYAPNSPYSASKAASDHLVRAYHHTYGLSVTTSNCSNNYGPRHFPEKLIPLIIVNILRGLPLPIYGDGRNVRDWLHVEDHCRGIALAIEKGVPGEVYNIGGGAEAENIVLVGQLCALVDAAFAADATLARRFPHSPPAQGRESRSLITYVQDRAGHDRRYAIDCRKAERELGYRARFTLENGLRETVDWYLGNESWWRAVLEGTYQKVSPGSA